MAVLPAPVWEGESLAGKTIVVYFEQGLGDTLHFVRYLKLLARSAGHVIAVVQPPLLTLMRSIPEAEFTTTFDGLSCDFQIPLMCLPRREDSPWYPTASLFHQRTPGDWAEVAERVALELARRIA